MVWLCGCFVLVYLVRYCVGGVWVATVCCLLFKMVFLFMFWVFCLVCAVGGLLILVSVPGGFDLLSSLLVCFCLIVLVTRFFA